MKSLLQNCVLNVSPDTKKIPTKKNITLLFLIMGRFLFSNSRKLFTLVDKNSPNIKIDEIVDSNIRYCVNLNGPNSAIVKILNTSVPRY